MKSKHSMHNLLLPGTALLALLMLTACERPPIDAEQTGYRGTAMADINNPRTEVQTAAANQVPDPLPPAPAAGPKARDIYQNVEVLGDLSVGQFARVMAAMTAWVSPEQGCNYCHLGENLASDDLYTKRVSRRMLQMTQDINSNWDQHVANTGVTCYTCHRGKNVPAEIWYTGDTPEASASMAGYTAGQNVPAPASVYASLPADPFSGYLTESDQPIRVQTAALSSEDKYITIQHTEKTYGLMMHMSDSLGANCTLCHNSASWGNWSTSNPQRVTAWHGIQMVKSLNEDYLNPLQPEYPDYRLGSLGDAPKANCATCHQGVQKPLYGVSMLPDYPSLASE